MLYPAEVIERPQYEFRGFVHKHKLNAVSQYFSGFYFADITRDQAKVCLSSGTCLSLSFSLSLSLSLLKHWCSYSVSHVVLLWFIIRVRE